MLMSFISPSVHFFIIGVGTYPSKPGQSGRFWRTEGSELDSNPEPWCYEVTHTA